MQHTLAKIEFIEQLNKDHFRLSLNVGWENFIPGQFVMVHPPEQSTFLSRPFGIVKLQDGIIELCIKIVGSGTQALAQAQAGQTLKALGPLGNGFKVQPNIEQAIIVAGGYGIAPLLPLAKLIKQQGKIVNFYYGAKTAEDLLYTAELEKLDINLNFATEDGSKGKKCLILDICEPDFQNIKQAAAFASGPTGLLHALGKLTNKYNIPTQISLDRYMACGIGVCLGCMVKKTNGNLERTCREGPVFDSEKILLKSEDSSQETESKNSDF